MNKQEARKNTIQFPDFSAQPVTRSRSDPTMVAVGFSPRIELPITLRRGATLDIRQSRNGLRHNIMGEAEAFQASRRDALLAGDSVRGLKPTATLRPSLRESRPRREATQQISELQTAPRKTASEGWPRWRHSHASTGLVLVLYAILSWGAATAVAQTTAFTYQGRLNDSTGPASGTYEFRFAIYDSQSGGNQIGGVLTNTAAAVSNGLFTVSLDFGPGVFNGADRWLELGARANGGGAFATLAPRQQITATPYAIQAASAGTVAAANISGTLTPSQLPAVVLTNGASGVVISGTFTGSGNGLTNVPGALPPRMVIGTNAAALANAANNLTNSSSTTLFLPDNPSVGDVVRISGLGTGAWSVTGSESQQIAGHQPGIVWTPHLYPLSTLPDHLAISADGQRLVAPLPGDQILISTDGGQTWDRRGGARFWDGVASSADGMKLAASESFGNLWISTDGGTNWTPVATNREWGALASSADGRKLFALGTQTLGYDAQPFFTSVDSGANWAAQPGASNFLWTAIAASADGSRVAAAAQYDGSFNPGYLYLSTDGGTNWVARAPNLPWAAVACSADGMTMVAAEADPVFYGVPGQIYTSLDGGTNWVAQPTAGTNFWIAVSVSAFGNTMMACDWYSRVYASYDRGATWAVSASQTAPVDPNTGAISGDGNTFFVADGYAQLSISRQTPLTGGQGVTADIQYVGNGLWQPMIPSFSSVSLTDDSSIQGHNSFEFGAGLTKEVNAGKIAYQEFSDGLDIVGAGTNGTSRKITFWAEGGATFIGPVLANQIVGSQILGSQIAANQLYATNLYIPGNAAAEFGRGIPNKEVSAGKIGYQTFSESLDIVGAGTNFYGRRIKMWAEGGTLFTGPVAGTGFFGDGSGLSNLSFASITGVLAQAQMPAGVLTNGATNITLTGVFSGNAGGLTNLNAGSISGVLKPAQLPAGILSNNATSVTLSGVFSGNGGGLTILNAGSVTGVLALAQLPAGLLTNNSSGVTLAGAFSGDGGGLTNLSVNSSRVNGTISLAQLPASLVTNGQSGLTLSGVFSGSGAGLSGVDLRTASSAGAIAWVTNFAGFQFASSIGGNAFWSVTAADVNGDGKPDVITANAISSSLSVFTNNGNGGLVQAATLGAGYGASSVIAVDVNGDGKLDLVCANANGNTLSVLTNNGNGGFATASTPVVGRGPRSVVAADVNGDGRVALISANADDSNLSVATNNGSGVFSLAATLGAGSIPVWVAAADVNGDGRVDVISANVGDSTLSVLTNNGSGGFVLASTLGVGVAPEVVVAVDVNGDGKTDLISANNGPNTLSVLTNNGSGGFVLASSPSVGNGPRCVIATDVNRDGKLDLITANVGDNTLSVLTNNGSGGFVLAASPSVGNYAYSAAAADLNGDGFPDLISANSGDNTLWVLTNVLADTCIFAGNGAGLTGLDASKITTGTLPLSQLPPATLINGAAGVTLSGSFSGNGGGLTNLNVSNITGTNAILNGLKIPGSQTVEFGSGVAGKELNAGKIGYETFTTNALDIVGAGDVVANRRVQIWAEAGAAFTGPITVGGAVSASGFSGSGFNLTSLNASNLLGPVPVASLTSLPAANLTGAIADARLSANVPLLNGTNVFAAANRFAGVIQATNVNNQLNGTFIGNGGGLTNVNTANLTGTLTVGQLPPSVLTNNQSGVTLSGSFSGNGGGLTNLNASQLTSGTVADARLSTNVALLSSSSQAFTGTNIFSGRVGLRSAQPEAALEIQAGADGDGSNDPMAMAFAWRSGGYRHWIRSRHNNGGLAGNALDFFLNTGSNATNSTAPGISNVLALTVEATGVTLTNLTANGKIASPMWRATNIINTVGPLGLTNSFTSGGGTLLISASGSGFSTNTIISIGMNILLDGVAIDTCKIFNNNTNAHIAFVSKTIVKTGVTAGAHTLALTTLGSTLTDFNDNFNVTIQELPY